MTSQQTARIYLRRNGAVGSSYRGVADTGHSINEDSGRFDVWSVHNEDRLICKSACRAEAEAAIANDWDRVSLKIGGAA